jgi:hypothetical protein
MSTAAKTFYLRTTTILTERERRSCMPGPVDAKTMSLRLSELIGHPGRLTPRRVGTN